MVDGSRSSGDPAGVDPLPRSSLMWTSACSGCNSRTRSNRPATAEKDTGRPSEPGRFVPVGTDGEPDMDAIFCGERFQGVQIRTPRFVKMETVDDHHRRREDPLFGQIAQPFFELRNREAFDAEGHDEPVGQDRFPEAADLRPFITSRKMMKKLAVPEVHLVDGIVQADVKDILVSQHAVQGQLDQQGGLPDAGMGKNGAESRRREGCPRSRNQADARGCEGSVLFSA